MFRRPWLFAHDIVSIIKYDGSNSHMAVRAAAFSLLAAIGVGENQQNVPTYGRDRIQLRRAVSGRVAETNGHLHRSRLR